MGEVMIKQSCTNEIINVKAKTQGVQLFEDFMFEAFC